MSALPLPVQPVDATLSISFFLLGFESQGVAHIACDPKVPGFSAAAKSSKNPRRIGIHSVFLLQDKKVLRRPVEPAYRKRTFGSAML